MKKDHLPDYTIIKEKVGLKDGFNMRNSVNFVVACVAYSNLCNQDREVFITNLSTYPDMRVNAKSIMGIMTIEAYHGSLLEIKIEGTDNFAKDFALEIKRGLNEEEYLYNKFYPLYKKIR